MIDFLKKAENAHSQIDSLIKGDPMKDYLKNMTGLKDMYKFGAKDSLMFRNNLNVGMNLDVLKGLFK